VDRAFSSALSASPAILPPIMALSLSAGDLRRVMVFVVCLVVATAFHEYAHAITAHKLGDRTPESDGRVTLNPMAHADPIGTIALPLIAGLTHAPLLGWGRPVMTRPQQYTRRISMRAGMALVSFAGPLSNILQAAITLGVAALLIFAAGLTPAAYSGLFAILGVFFVLNLTLAVFNLLPLHPLDGGKILAWALPPRFDYIDEFLAKYGWVFLLGIMLAPQILTFIFAPLMKFAFWAMAAVSPAWATEYVRWLTAT
jgi:Zn-dependent protease